MNAIYDLPAPGKLNLFLHITGQRPDGYHLLQSVFMLVDWCDTLHVDLRRDGQITREDLSTPLPADDLCLRAAHALQKATGSQLGAHIAVQKNLPAQAGMGGGSSDAATVLLALNRLWHLHLDHTELAAIGLKLGADVPFFVHGQNAWVEGIGEKITPIALPAAKFVVIKPNEGLSTQAIFSASSLQRATKPAIVTDFAANPFGFGRNDLQPVAEALSPSVLQAVQLLAARGLSPRMTGSGSAVFAHLTDSALAPELNMCDCLVQTCSSLDVHPLHGWAAGHGLRL